MITTSDLNINNKSYIKKDFYQIYPEIVDLVKELTEYWDPENTNESDPGVVLLKIAAFVADKLNYNIDKNILEAFITSATQEEAVRKICELMGYNMKYYNSATTEVSFMWTGEELPETSEEAVENGDSITLPWFDTKLTNEAGDIIYTLVNTVVLNRRYVVNNTARAIQGDVVDLEINEDNVLTADNLDSRNRFYLPELAIAENGIWIFNKEDISEDGVWTRIDNLNTEILGKTVWKFGYDSKLNKPYIQFPSDIVSLMKNGLVIKYARTAGKNGNIKANTLTKLQNQTLYTKNNLDNPIQDVEAKLLVKNLSATTNGTDIETIDEAYENYKKTIGIFDTLVTCRDYAAAIYKMVFDEKLNNNPIVSNCQVSDIRSDINFANNVVKYGNLGTYYEDVAETEQKEITAKLKSSGEETQVYIESPKISDYDLLLYPLNPIYNSYNENTFVNSFTPLVDNTDSVATIKRQLLPYKTISHKIKQVSDIDNSGNNIYLYKNLYKLNAKVITQNKVNTFEQEEIRQNIFKALYENFNPRHLEYGEEIPYDRLLSVMEKADPRIKLVNLDEPVIQSYYMTDDGEDHLLYSNTQAASSDGYLKMVAKNILGARIPLFDYNKDITVSFDCTNVENMPIYDRSYGSKNIYFDGSAGLTVDNCSITHATTHIDLSNVLESSYKLDDNEVVQLVTGRLVTDYAYPLYTNYFIKLNSESEDLSNTYIKANLPYKLKQGEILYINYTDGDDNKEYWIEYSSDNKKTIVNGVEKNEKFCGIIQTNFDLYDSKYSAVNKCKKYSKKKESILPEWATVEGMFSLQTTEEIDIMSYAFTQLESDTAYLYWIANNNNTLTFLKYKVETNYVVYSYILDDGEYIFYTDSSKTNLITIGSGNRINIRKAITSSSNILDSITWYYNTSSAVISADSVMEKGIGAFSDIDWVVKHFSKDEWLQVDQMEIRTISSGRTINELKLIFDDGDDEFESSKWRLLDKITYDDAYSIETTDAQKWFIRPMLNLNIGPNKIQKIKSNHAISFYTSWYYLKDDETKTPIPNNKIYDYLKYNPSKIEENIYIQTPIIRITDLGDSGDETFMAIKSNLNVQRSGGTLFSLHTSGINASKYDNLSIFTIDTQLSDIIATPRESTEKVELNSADINFTEYSSATFPIYVPNNNYNIISIYYSANSDVEKFEIKVNNGRFIEYTHLFDDNIQYNTSKKYTRGLHHFVIFRDSNEHCTMELSSAYKGTKAIVVANKLVQYKKTEYKGLNYKAFNLISPNDYKTLFNTYIKNQDNFYATVDIENNMLLDFDNLTDPYCLFNYNNIINHFVLSELDVDSFDNIQIATSSKVNR